jgi:DNA repair protein RadC
METFTLTTNFISVFHSKNKNMKKLTRSIVSEIEVSYQPKQGIKQIINSSWDAYEIVKGLIPKQTIALKEYFVVLYLNQANRVLGAFKVSDGGITSTVADVRLIFSVALKSVACNFIICHNHPSGNLKPSKADILLTEKLREGGRLLDIKLLDHIIIGPEEGKCLSMADEGLL